MAETIVSPGVLAIENDQSFITQQPIQAGAAIIGPTIKGKVGIPVLCTTYSDYLNKFGSTFLSGSQTFTYFTSIAAYNYFNSGGDTLLVTRVVSGSTTTDWTPATSSFISSSAHSAGSPYNTSPFILETLSEGEIMNSAGPTGSNGSLLSGSSENFRWQITNNNINDGTFSLIIRQGNDTSLFPSVLETWNNLSLDPLASNYIEKVIGNQVENILQDAGEYYVQMTGSYANNSRYVRVKNVLLPTPEYLNNNGDPKSQFTGSIPITSSGTFGSAKGTNIPSTTGKYFENITNSSIQGLSANDYTSSISLLANKDAYKYNLLTAPGLIADSTNYPLHTNAVNLLLNTVQDRGDSMTILDLVGYGSNITPVTINSITYNTSYAAAYWPWVKTVDPNTGNQVWVPASVMIPGIYAFNDKIAAPWFAPAGINRGVLSNVIQAERYLTQGNRDTLYESNVNSIATFPNTGVVVFGQKTLQKKKSALDRVNVRRLLIELKNYISQIADSLVFEQNNLITRNNFLSQVNPYLSSIQQQQGLTDFRGNNG
jgi:hypothetical protein